MFAQVSKEQFLSACQDQKRAVVYREFPCDDVTPTQAFLSLHPGEGAALLESAVQDEQLGRYSLLALEPFAKFSSKGRVSHLIFQGIAEPIALSRCCFKEG